MHGIPPLSLKLLKLIVNNEKAPTFCEDWGFDGIHSFPRLAPPSREGFEANVLAGLLAFPTFGSSSHPSGQ